MGRYGLECLGMGGLEMLIRWGDTDDDGNENVWEGWIVRW